MFSSANPRVSVRATANAAMSATLAVRDSECEAAPECECESKRNRAALLCGPRVRMCVSVWHSAPNASRSTLCARRQRGVGREREPLGDPHVRVPNSRSNVWPRSWKVRAGSSGRSARLSDAQNLPVPAFSHLGRPDKHGTSKARRRVVYYYQDGFVRADRAFPAGWRQRSTTGP
eukprot:6183552-Pleurochrysis_carterae.AAC.3